MLATKHIGEQYTSWSVSCEREVAQEHQSRLPPVEAAWPYVDFYAQELRLCERVTKTQRGDRLALLMLV